MKEKVFISVSAPGINTQLNRSALLSLMLVALTMKVNARHFKHLLPVHVIKLSLICLKESSADAVGY